jgi:hypothetical protein
VRYLILGLFALAGLACSKTDPVGGEGFIWPPMAAVEGRVVSQSGVGIGNATITVTALRERPVLDIQVGIAADTDGYFKFLVQAPGDFSVPSIDTASVQLATQRPGANSAAQIDTVLLRFSPRITGVPSPKVNRLDVRLRGQ